MSKEHVRPDDAHWRVSTPEILLKTPVVNILTSNLVNSRTDTEKKFYRFDFPSWVNIVARTEHHELILIEQYRFGTGKTELEIPGGAVEHEEPPLDAGLRELLEETGYAGENGKIIGAVCPNPALQNNLCYTVFVDNVKKVSEPQQDDMEDIRTLLLPEKEVFSRVKKGHINHGLVLNGLMFYKLFS